jgi:hypothetical protein
MKNKITAGCPRFKIATTIMMTTAFALLLFLNQSFGQKKSITDWAEISRKVDT